MATRLAYGPRDVGRRIAYGTAAAAVVLLWVLALRADAFEGWMWGSLMILMFLVVSLRSALVWAFRKRPARLSCWFRPTRGVENEFTVAWLVSAVHFGAFSVLPVLL